jgi:exodeoxyribonuclease III
MADFLKIATWNINSVRIRADQTASWLQLNNIDILLLQELKCENDSFPNHIFEDLGYNCYVHGQKSYNGVAILSRFPADEIITNFENNPIPDQARYIEANLNLPIGYTTISSVYVPNGGEVGSDKFDIKLKFYDAFKNYSAKKLNLSNHLIIGGDFNVALNEKDVFSIEEMKEATCFTDIEREKLNEFLSMGIVDCQKFFEAKNIFTWWDYRAGCWANNKGLRIDYIFNSPSSADLIKNYYVDKIPRSNEKASDHTPVIAEYYKD